MSTRPIEDELVYILFLEGIRSRNGAMAAFQPGLGAFVASSPVPVVPCHIEGAFAAWPAHRRLPRPGKLRLRVGAPFHFIDTPQDCAGWTEVAAQCEAAMRGLGAAAP